MDRFQRYSALLDDFVALHEGMVQRGPEWYQSMATTCGGSELAALLGCNPYSREKDVVASKVAALQGVDTFRGGEACWWGTLFEDVIEAVVAIDLGAPVRGSDICVRVYPGHRNSPDGYIVARVYRGADGETRLWTTDLPDEVPTAPRTLLLEFKCPHTRAPDGRVPRQYMPQLWSGLAVSPVAHSGLFVDACFRKCALADLGPTPAYDAAYHYKAANKGTGDEQPVAWGLIAVYAPCADAPLRVRMGWKGEQWAAGDPDPDGRCADASQTAWRIHAEYFGLQPSGCDGDVVDIVDLGDMAPRLFAWALGEINRGRFRADRLEPCFADGRGGRLQTDREVGAAVERARRNPPPHHWLLAVLPWKLFDVWYVPVARRPGFMDEVLPLIQDVHRAAAEAVASPDPEAYLSQRQRDKMVQMYGPEALEPKKGDSNTLQDLFDVIS